MRYIGTSFFIVFFFLLINFKLIAQEPLFKQVLVSDIGFSNNIGSANTSRNVAIDKDGTIYVAYTGTSGIRVAKSINRGESFLPSVSVINSNIHPEIAIGDDGILYVAWIEFGEIFLSRSTDKGLSFSDRALVGRGSDGFENAPHMAIFEDNVYIVDQRGTYTYTNNTKGVGSFKQTVMPKMDVYADVRTDKNGVVYVPSDDPVLYLSKSENSGATFQVANLSSVGPVFFSSYALSDGPAGTFIFVGGSGDLGYKINAFNGVGKLINLGNNIRTTEGRTLYADSFGALVDGFQDESGDLIFNVSYDQGESFTVSVNVARGGSHNIDRNPLYDDINVAYEQDGNVYMNVYDGLLRGIKISETINTLSLCAGEEFDLPYTLSGNFSPDSEFVAYLSDEDGSFENKTFLGRVISNVDGNIECKIPESIPNSENYRIQIQSLANFIQSNIIDVNIGGEIIAVKPDDMIGCNLNATGALFDLTNQDELIKNGKTTAIVSYFESKADAESNLNSIIKPEEYEVSSSKTIWVRLITGTESKCPSFDITSFELNVENFTIDETVFEIYRCSDELNTNYDLTEKELLISSNNDVVFSYYESQFDLEAEIKITDPTLYNSNSLTSSILVLVENEKCSITTSLDLVTTIRSVYNETPLPLEICDNDNDGFEKFNLLEIESDILDGLATSNYVFTYYETLTEAELGSDKLIKVPTDFLNTQRDSQIIYSRIEEIGTVCFSVIPFEIVVNISPILAVKPDDLIGCSNTNGMSFFNLRDQNSIIINGQTDVEVSYFTSEFDALNKNNRIPDEANYESSNNTIWARLETSANTSAFTCPGFDIVSFDLELKTPIVNQPTGINLCSDTLNTIYDLTVKESEITTDQNSSFTYYATEEDLNAGLEIANPNSYESDSLTKSIIVLVTDATNCSITTSLELTATINAVYNTDPQVLETCDSDNDGFEEFNLTNVESVVLDGLLPANDHNFKYYQNLNDAELFNNSDIKNTTAFTNTIKDLQTIYAAIQQPNSECYQVVSFQIKVNRTIEPKIEVSYSLCLDNDDKVIESLTSNLENSIPIDTGLNPLDYDFEWYRGVDVSMADIIIGEIRPFYNPDKPGFYTVLVTDKLTGCKGQATTEVIGSYPPISVQAEVISLPFSENNMISVSVEGKGKYEYKIDEGLWQESNLFENLSEGEHVVYVRDILNCDSLSDIEMVIDYPRFFTPNDDGANDFWKIEGVGVPESINVFIYDRYGKLVKNILPKSKGWNGQFDGKPLPSNEYWFTLEYKESNDSVLRQVRGHFSLIR